MSKPEKSWFRAYAEMVDDEKLRLLAFEDRWHFVALMCCKRSGLLDNGDPHDLLCRKVAVKLGLQLRELEAMGARLGEVGLIDPVTFQPLAWAERQFESDTSTARVREYRERKRLANEERYGETDMKRFSSVSETAQETETETEHIRTAREPEPANDDFGPVTVESGASATAAAKAMIEAGMPASRMNPSHPELLAAVGDGVTPTELADVVRECFSRGTGPPALVYVIRTAVGRRKTAVHQQEHPDDRATRQPSPNDSRPRSANARMLAAIKRRRAREAEASASMDAAGTVAAGGDG